MSNYFKAENISKDYTDLSGFTIHLLENINFEVHENTITSIVAPTGSGKSSLIKIVCGLETATNGRIEINSDRRRVIYIPSNPSSFPWFNVWENVSLGSSDKKIVEAAIVNCGLEGYEKHYPDNDSVAFRFRVALARAIATGVKFIALDEPFAQISNPKNLERVYSLLYSLKKKLGLTILLGTSNLSEAILLSDKVYTMDKDPGRITSEFNIELGEEREIDLMNSVKFIEYREKIEKSLKHNKTQFLSNIKL